MPVTAADPNRAGGLGAGYPAMIALPHAQPSDPSVPVRPIRYSSPIVEREPVAWLAIQDDHEATYRDAR